MPPTLRRLARLPTHRAFSTTTPRHTFLDATTSALTALHATTGLSWGVLIPLGAITIRATITLPLTLYARSKSVQMIGLIPVIEARAHNVAQRSAAQRTNPDKWEKAVQKAARREGNAVLARWGCQRWKSYVPFLQMPVWVVASAVLRGLLPGRSGGGEKAEAVVVDAAAAATAGKEPVAEVASDWIVRAFGGISQAPSEELVAQLQTEGLWAVDLTASDPTLLLPFALWAAVSANAGFMYMTSPATGKWAVRVSRIMMVLLFAMGYVASSAPAALVLYWVTSAAWSLWVNVALHFAWPLPKKVNKCKVQGPEGVKKEGKKERN